MAACAPAAFLWRVGTPSWCSSVAAAAAPFALRTTPWSAARSGSELSFMQCAESPRSQRSLNESPGAVPPAAGSLAGEFARRWWLLTPRRRLERLRRSGDWRRGRRERCVKVLPSSSSPAVVQRSFNSSIFQIRVARRKVCGRSLHTVLCYTWSYMTQVQQAVH